MRKIFLLILLALPINIMAQQGVESSDYIKAHKWNLLPIGSLPIQCDYCNHITTDDTVYIFSMKNDSICYASVENFDLGTKIVKCHVSKIPNYVKNNSDFINHCDVFKDSLENNQFDFDRETVEYRVSPKSRLQSLLPFSVLCTQFG